MTKISRGDLLKAFAALIVAAVLVIAGKPGVIHAAPAGGTGVHIHGTVTSEAIPGLVVAINIDVSGPHGDLSGAGWDAPIEGGNLLPPGACYYTQAGSVHGRTVHVEGTVFFANNPDDVGAPVITDANLATGAITWQFGPFVFQGVGTVIRK